MGMERDMVNVALTSMPACLYALTLENDDEQDQQHQ